MLSQGVLYLKLMRMHRPIGTLLLLWPTLTGLWIAGQGQPACKWIVIFTLGVIVMRAAGCILNDMADKDFDKQVERTQDRPLAAGLVSLKEARVLCMALLSVAFFLVCTLDRYTLMLSLIALALASGYPFMKRYTHFPQVVLGVAFAWGIPMAYAAQSQPFTVEGILLFLATFFWIIAYDTQYAMADRKADLCIGVKSTAIAFGQYDKAIIFCLQSIMLGLLWGMGKIQGWGFFYHLCLVLVFGLFIYQQWLIRDRNPLQCLHAFLNNQWVGLLIFLGTVLSLRH